MKPEIQKQIAPEVENTAVPKLQWGDFLFGGRASAKYNAWESNRDGRQAMFYVGINDHL